MSELPAIHLDPFRARPRLSVVVAWQGCAVELSRRLRSWTQQLDDRSEVIVVSSCNSAESQSIARAHPGVQLIRVARNHDLPFLRELGVQSSTGDVVVILDDTVGADASWRDRIPVANTELSPRVGRENLGYHAESRIADATLR
jgi:hypothetical protein